MTPEPTKPCTLCGQTKPISQFGTKPTGRIRSRCRDCQKAYQRNYYWADVEVSRQIDRMRYAAKKTQLTAK